MSQNITLLGASYSDVPAVELPKTGGGTALFHDVTDTTATAALVASGYYFHAADGTKIAGTLADGDLLEYGVSTQPLVGTARVGATQI